MMEQSDPFALFAAWMEDAIAAEPALPEAMCLSTAAADGTVSSRMVLLKGYDRRGFVFYTNFDSRKGHDLDAGGRASLCLHWKSLERQITIQGTAEPVDGTTADAYFASRPRGAQIGAWASKQSETMTASEALKTRVVEFSKKFGEAPVPRPPNWSGFCIVPNRIEFWQGRESRLHDRIVFSRLDDNWAKETLYP